MEQVSKKRLYSFLLVLAIVIAIALIIYFIMRPNNNPEVLFSQTVEEGTAVYIDISSIVPYKNDYGSGNIVHSILCQCLSSQNNTVWVYMTLNQYQEYFDSDAHLTNSDGYQLRTYSTPIRLHGTAMAGADALDCYSSLAFNFTSADIQKTIPDNANLTEIEYHPDLAENYPVYVDIIRDLETEYRDNWGRLFAAFETSSGDTVYIFFKESYIYDYYFGSQSTTSEGDFITPVRVHGYIDEPHEYGMDKIGKTMLAAK